MAEVTQKKTTIAIDPVTRIEGHLKAEVVVENGKVVGADGKDGHPNCFHKGVADGRRLRCYSADDRDGRHYRYCNEDAADGRHCPHQD